MWHWRFQGLPFGLDRISTLDLESEFQFQFFSNLCQSIWVCRVYWTISVSVCVCASTRSKNSCDHWCVSVPSWSVRWLYCGYRREESMNSYLDHHQWRIRGVNHSQIGRTGFNSSKKSLDLLDFFRFFGFFEFFKLFEFFLCTRILCRKKEWNTEFEDLFTPK